jgi:hypothetical protein
VSEIIEFACDICGQKYRYSEERMGRKTDCRECGAPFELNKHTIAKDEDEDGSDDEEMSPWILIRSAFVGTLLFFIIGGLCYLPFYTPDGRSLMAATTPSGQRGNSPTGFGQPSFPANNFPQHNPSFSPPGFPNAGNPNAGMPGNNSVWPPPRTNHNLRSGAKVPGAADDSIPGRDPAGDTEVAAAIGAKLVPEPSDVPKADAPEPEPEKPSKAKPEKPMAADAGEPDTNDDPGDVPNDFKKAPFVRSVSIGKLEGRDNHIVVKGANLSKVTHLHPIYDPFWPLNNVQFTVTSKNRIDTHRVTFAGGYKPIGVVLVSAEGTTIAIPEDSMRVSKDESSEPSDKIPVIVVERGGTLTTSSRTVVVVEPGGTVNISSPFGAYVALKGSTVRSDFPLHKAFMATGAKYEPRIRTGFALERTPVIRVIKLKSESSDE